MALRPGRTTRKKERAYTRVSKRKPRQSYVVGVPYPSIHMFEMGTKGDYDCTLYLVSKREVQIRHNALEAARIVAHKFLEKKLGLSYFLKILVFPHHVIREKPIAMGAGADRYSRGMKMAFGRPSGMAAQMKKNQRIMKLQINRKSVDIGKLALKKAGLKLPTRFSIEIEE